VLKRAVGVAEWRGTTLRGIVEAGAVPLIVLDDDCAPSRRTSLLLRISESRRRTREESFF